MKTGIATVSLAGSLSLKKCMPRPRQVSMALKFLKMI